uniref:Uncharacterized protein n=1 Tax=Arundo donax TaxID=35708 RepID=A0A0A8ZZU1_ARUDO
MKESAQGRRELGRKDVRRRKCVRGDRDM